MTFTLHNGYCVKWKCETTPASTTPGRCEGSYTTPAKCEPTAEHGRYEYSDDSPFVCENFNGFSSDECNNTLGVRIQLDGYGVPKEVAARFSDYGGFRSIVFPSGVGMGDPSQGPIFAKCSDELAPLWNACPYFERVKGSNFYNEVGNILDVKSICVFKNSTSQSCNGLTQTECGKQSGCTRTSGGSSSPVPPSPPRPGRPKLPPSAPSIPWSPSKVVKCMDEQGNERPDAYCANAGAKPLCDAEWACAVPTVPGTQGCTNPTTKDSSSLCVLTNNVVECNNTLEVIKHCLSSHRNCASDEYRFEGGSEMSIKTTVSDEVAESLTWNSSLNLYVSDLPDQEPFGYELLGACSRGEPKASASCKSISGKYDKYCSDLTAQGSCDMVNVYQKREYSSGPITIGIFKHSGQCSVSTYDFDNWEEQYDPVCPGIHQKSFKYMDSCEWGVRKEVVCQSRSSNAILNDSECNETEKPDYNMICGGRSSKSTPPTPPTPPASSSEDTSGLYRATSYSWSIHCIEGSSMYIGVCNQNDGIFMGDSISVSKGILWDHLGIYSPRPDKKIWIKDGFAYWDKDKTQPVEAGVYKLTQYGISGDEVPYRYFTVSGGYGPGYQLGRGRIVETLK